MGLTNTSHLGYFEDSLFVVKGEGRGLGGGGGGCGVRNILLKLEKHPTKVRTQSLSLSHTQMMQFCLLGILTYGLIRVTVVERERERASELASLSVQPATAQTWRLKERKINHDCWTHIRVYYHTLPFPKRLNKKTTL